MSVRDERHDLRNAYPNDFDKGVRDGLTLQFDDSRDKGGYPTGFHRWPSKRKGAYFAGYNVGRMKRLRLSKMEAAA